MDCPNCGAYNATNSFRCRRCNQILQPEESAGESGEEVGSREPEWGPASRPEVSEPRDDWEIHFRGDDVPDDRPSVAPSSTYNDPDVAWPAMSHSSEPEAPGSVPNYLLPSIGATICCCAPLGIPAIIFASRVDAYLESGDRAAAEEASNKAKMWALASFAVALLIWIAIFCTGQFGGGAV